MKGRIFALVVIFTLLLTSCTTIGTQQYTYVGDVTTEKNIMGQSTHVDFFGLGISAKSYANEYNRAVKDAFDQAEPGTTKLKSVKVFKENKYWPQILGYSAMLVSSVLIASADGPTSAGIPLAVFSGGFGLTGINTYNFVVVGEPDNSKE